MHQTSYQEFQMGGGYEGAPPAYTYTISHLGSNTSTEGTAELSQADIQEIDKSLSWIPNAPTISHPTQPLEKPILIPQLSLPTLRRPTTPFTRAFPPILNNHNISIPDFMNFIDNLTIAMSPSPPFQVLNIAGMGIGMVPHHWAQAASLGIGLASGAGTAAVAYARTKRFLEVFNREVFWGRGLRVRLVKDRELEGNLGKEMSAGMVPREEGKVQSLRDRRFEALKPFFAELSFDVPPPAEQTNVLDKVVAKQVKRKISKRERKEVEEKEKELKEKDKHLRKAARRSGSSLSDIDYDLGAVESDASSIISLNGEISSLQRKIEKIDRKSVEKSRKTSKAKKLAEIEEKRVKEIEKLEKEIRKAETDLDKKYEKSDKKAVKKGDKELKKVGKMRWILIENF